MLGKQAVAEDISEDNPALKLVKQNKSNQNSYKSNYKHQSTDQMSGIVFGVTGKQTKIAHQTTDKHTIRLDSEYRKIPPDPNTVHLLQGNDHRHSNYDSKTNKENAYNNCT